MIDIHSHIIPNLDDGARSWDETVRMCVMAVEDGIRTIVATPHAYNGVYDVSCDQVNVSLGELKNRLRERNIPLEVFGGAEIHSRPDLSTILLKEPALTFNQNGNTFLLEFPHSVIPPHSDRLIYDLRLKNLTPVIAHPERNLHIQRDTSQLKRLVDAGAYCQITAMSLTGGFGERARACALSLLDLGYVHFVASDCHNANGRPPVLSGARQVISELQGAERAKSIFEEMPKKMIHGELN